MYSVYSVYSVYSMYSLPGPVVVQQVGETEELGLEDGGVAPVDWSVLTGGEDVTPGVLRGGSI